jgi:hypothetical protein
VSAARPRHSPPPLVASSRPTAQLHSTRLFVSLSQSFMLRNDPSAVTYRHLTRLSGRRTHQFRPIREHSGQAAPQPLARLGPPACANRARFVDQQSSPERLSDLAHVAHPGLPTEACRSAAGIASPLSRTGVGVRARASDPEWLCLFVT